MSYIAWRHTHDQTNNNPIPVAVAMLFIGGRLVVIKRGIEPCIGGWALPGGYVDDGETAEQACAREFEEELGLHTDPASWKLFGSEITPTNRLLLFLVRRVDADPLIEQRIRPRLSEVLDWSFMDRLGAEPLCFPLHQKRAAQVTQS